MSNQKQTLCLNMIVRNEASIIVDTLANLCQHLRFDYWVIVDTGSDDNTAFLINEFFNQRQIPGELIHHKWENFARNRSMALEMAYCKTDYSLIFDADDRIIGTLVFPVPLTADSYMIKMGKGFEWNRPLLINNRKRWFFKGVIHEYLTTSDSVTPSIIIDGDYYIAANSVQGARSRNPDKFKEDAVILSKAFADAEKAGEHGEADRYAFYCAQSYKDCGLIDDSIAWYKKVLDRTNWTQEKYYSCYRIGGMYMIKNEHEHDNAIKYWLKSIEYDTERIECIMSIVNHYYDKGYHVLVNALYHRFKNYNKSLAGKLFIDQTQYKDMLEFKNSISAFYAKDHPSGYACCKQIIINNIVPKALLTQTFLNIMFYKEFMFCDPVLNTSLLPALTELIVAGNTDEALLNLYNIVQEKVQCTTIRS